MAWAPVSASDSPVSCCWATDVAADPHDARQLAFRFDDEAQVRTSSALLSELPDRIASGHPSGVEFGDVLGELCNETRAARAQLATAVGDPCVEPGRDKLGGAGETCAHDDVAWG
jgi:hypothetical protein